MPPQQLVPTELGYGAAVFPQSKFDPTTFGQQVAQQRKVEAEKKEKEEKELEEDIMNTLNPKLPQLKWSNILLGEFEPEYKRHRDDQIKLLDKQNGRLSRLQINEAKYWQERQKAKAAAVNAYYTRIIDAEKLIRSDKRYNTPENRDIIRNLMNISGKTVQKAGGVMKYLENVDPLSDIKPKAEVLDKIKIFKKIRDHVGYAKGIPTTTGEVDEAGNVIYTTDYKNKLQAAKEAAQDEWESNPTVRDNYENEDKFVTEAVQDYMRGTPSQEGTIKGLPKEGKGLNISFGGGTRSKDVKIAEDKDPIRITDVEVDESGVETKGKEYSYDATTYTLGKPMKVTINVERGGNFKAGKFVEDKKLRGQATYDISKVSYFKTADQKINLNDYKGKPAAKQLQEMYGSNVIPQGAFLRGGAAQLVESLGIGQIISEKAYGFGTAVKRAVEQRGDAEKVADLKEQRGNWIELQDVAPSLEAKGYKPRSEEKFSIPERGQENIEQEDKAKLPDFVPGDPVIKDGKQVNIRRKGNITYFYDTARKGWVKQ